MCFDRLCIRRLLIRVEQLTRPIRSMKCFDSLTIWPQLIRVVVLSYLINQVFWHKHCAFLWQKVWSGCYRTCITGIPEAIVVSCVMWDVKSQCHRGPSPPSACVSQTLPLPQQVSRGFSPTSPCQLWYLKQCYINRVYRLKYYSNETIVEKHTDLYKCINEMIIKQFKLKTYC